MSELDTAMKRVKGARLDTTRAELSQAGQRRVNAETERSNAHKELAQRVKNAARAGMGPTEIAEVAGVSRQTVHNILNR